MNTTKQLSINAIRILSAEAIQKANSGHPGLPLGCAPVGYTLFNDFLNFNPTNPKFENRDRFVLSAGHGSMLIYSLLHIFGYDLSIEDILKFRQVGSKTPGHPEYGHTVGVETTTGPLGQGIANAVGMAVAETYLANKFNRDGYDIVDHYTYALAGDGCMQEGIGYEATSFAGTYGLNKLILFYDDNEISIEGDTDITFKEDVGARFKAQGWQVINVDDANDTDAISDAIIAAKAEKSKPSLIILKSVIGYGSPLAGSHECHGAPLGAENIIKTREYFDWKLDNCQLPEEVKQVAETAKAKGKKLEETWNELFEKYKAAYPKLAAEYTAWMKNEMPDFDKIDGLWDYEKADATRNTNSKVLNKLADVMPNLIGGSADLSSSNKSIMTKRSSFLPDDKSGSNMHFGVREHAMAAISNGMYLHGGLTVYCATFFVFTDYMKNAMRLSALMDIPVIYILTHDSIGVGEDGPTHQPIEQLVGLRSIPNMKVYRPADGKECTAAWISALSGSQPTCLVLTRQNLPQYKNSGKNALLGGYVLEDSTKSVPDVILIASGSEVEIAVKAKAQLKDKNIDARVVSMPSMEVFESQSDEYKESVIPNSVRARVCVEAGSSYSWYKYAGIDGEIIGMDTFGASGPANELFTLFGFTAENVVEKAVKTFNRCK